MRTPIGFGFPTGTPPEVVLDSARLGESLGFASCWIAEDYFRAGGISLATAIAMRTTRLGVGLGVVSPLPRHPALTAMEVGTLDTLSGGRVTLGLGYGVRSWMEQMGLGCSSPLRALRESVGICRRLLAGETVDEVGTCFSLRAGRLSFQPFRPDIPIFLGVERERALQLSGEVADGTLLTVLSSPGYVAWACEQVRHGIRARSAPGASHRVVVYAFLSADPDGDAARDALRPLIAEYVGLGGARELTRRADMPDYIADGVRQRRLEGGSGAELVDDAAVDRMAVAGTPAECKAAIARLIAAGTDELVLLPFPAASISSQLETAARWFESGGELNREGECG